MLLPCVGNHVSQEFVRRISLILVSEELASVYGECCLEELRSQDWCCVRSGMLLKNSVFWIVKWGGKRFL